ncbi:hypothetical protein F5X99DRAFT_393171 [Biscogniauxia marginata]|nr:hypothetical protein F5X99DRAFT_393171 [Biscogniauxia marginata]
MRLLSYWVLPIISGLVWLATLLGLLLYWIVNTNQVKYPSMQGDQTIAYISDVGAAELKPLFVAGCIITTVFLDLSFIADRLLRHRGRLVPNTSLGEKVLSGLCIFFAFVGTIGLCLLSGFDTAHYPTLHNIFLLLFIAGYLLSAIFICWEYQRLGKKYTEHSVLRTSFWVKLTFVIVELLLAIVFIVTNFRRLYNIAAIFEWIIAFIFSFYIFSFIIDLYPAVATRAGSQQQNYRPATALEMEEARLDQPGVPGQHLASQDSDRTLTNAAGHPVAANKKSKTRTPYADF